MSNAIYCTFTRDKRGDVEEMIFHEVVRMSRRSDPESIDPAIPADIRPLLGGYYYAAVQAEFEILWDKRRPALYDPLQKETIPLKPGKKESTWTDRNDRFILSFSADPDGGVSMLELDSANRFRRK